MARYKEHADTGALVGILGGLVCNYFAQKKKKIADSNYQFNIGEFALCGVGGAAVGAVTGVLPDVLEPAIHSSHRKFFHSLTTAAAIGYGLHEANKSNLSPETKGAINVAGAGYLSHLMLDMDTPKGLPIL